MPQQIVQIAADALALGGRREPTHFVLRQLQRRILFMAGGLEVDHQADDHRHARDPDQRLPRIVGQQSHHHEQRV